MKRKLIKSISAFSLIGLLGLGAASCACENNDHSSSAYRWVGTEDTTASKIQLSLPDSLVVRADNSTYFAPYVVKEKDGKLEHISSGGDTLLESNQEAKLLAYWVPEGFDLFASVRNAKTGSPVIGVVLEDGSVKAPEVTEKTDYIITLSAVSKEKIAGTGEKTNRILKKNLNLTVVPSGKIKKGTTANYTTLTEKQRTEITANLEEYALEHGLTGVRFQSNGSKVLYRSRLTSPLLSAKRYIPTYGWGIEQYGEITSDLDKETNPAYKKYIHSLLSSSSDLGTVNYLNSKDKSVLDLYSYMSSSYYTKTLNSDFTATVEDKSLAREEPIPLNKDEKTGLATKWKIKVWVGGTSDDAAKGVKKGLSFRSGSTKSSAFDKKLITLEDYLTPFKALATGSVGWYRGNEMAESSQGKQRIVGFSDFYKSTENATSFPTSEEFSKKVGVSIDPTDNSVIIEFEQGFDQDFAKYYLDGLYANPMSEDFLKSLGKNVVEGAKVYGTSPEGKTPADTSLSVGPYYLEKYTPQQEIVFKKNEEWPLKTDTLGRELYKIPGKYFKVDTALETDREEAMKQYEAGYTDSVTLQTDAHFEKYGNNPSVRTVLPEGTFGTSFNRMDKALWDHYFGEGGIWRQEINPDGSLTKGFSVNPVLSNDNYFKALNLGFDRSDYAKTEHDVEVFEYFQPGQKVNPVTSTFYNDTPEHKNAVKNVYGNDFDNIKNAPSKAVQYMQDAIIEELDAGHLDLGTAEKPTDFGFQTSIMNTEMYKRIAKYQNQYWSKVFNEAVTSYVDDNGNNPLVADSKQLVSFTVSTKEYSTDASGQNAILNDIWAGVGNSQSVFSISGNSLDSIDYLDILSCNKVAGFELSFAVDTNVPSGTIEYDGSYWSFESLWWAVNGGATIDADGRGSALK